MKTFIFSALALGMMASCSNTEVEGIDAVDNGEPVAVNLIAGVQVSATSRAVIDEGSTFTASVFGWNVTGEATPEYATATPWTSLTGSIKAAAGGGEAVSLTDAQFYQTSGDKTYIKAVSPADGTIEGGVYTFKTPLTEEEDVLLTKATLTGDRKNATVALAFSHVLTRFNFKVVKGEHFDAGVTVSKIVVNGGKLAQKIDLATAEITPVEAKEINIAVNNVEINTPAANAGNPIMIVPCSAESLTLDIETTGAGNYTGITISPASGDNFIEGTSYDITLTFTGKSVGATASVGKWQDGTGSGTVQ